MQLLDTEHRMFVGGRRNQVDMRIAKILRFGPTRADMGLDLQNVFNTHYATAYQMVRRPFPLPPSSSRSLIVESLVIAEYRLSSE